jgi:hypothetical protein
MRYDLLSDTALNALCVKHGVTFDNVKTIIADCQYGLVCSEENQFVLFNGETVAAFGADDSDADTLFLSLLTDQEILAMEVSLRSLNDFNSQQYKSY